MLESEEIAWTLRIVERFSLTGIIVICTIVLMVYFWKHVSKLDFNLKNLGEGNSANVVLATPILLLAILVTYSFVTFSHPLTITTSQTTPDNQSKLSRNDAKQFFGGSDKRNVSQVFDALIQLNGEIERLRSQDSSSALMIRNLEIITDDLHKQTFITLFSQDVYDQCRETQLASGDRSVCDFLK